VFFTAFTPTRGLAVTHFKHFCNLRVWVADSHSDSVSRTTEILISERGRNYSEDFDSSRLLCRPVNTRSCRRVTPWTTDLEDEGTAVFRNVRNYLPVPQMFVLWFFTPCKVVSLIQHLSVPSSHSVTLQVQVAQFSEVLVQTHYCTLCKNPQVVDHMERGPF